MGEPSKYLQPTASEVNDLDWKKFQAEFDISKWDTKRIGQRRVGVALVGLGRIGLVHLRSCLRVYKVRLLYCFDIDQDRLDACNKSVFFKEFNTKALPSNQFEVALKDPNVDGVIVASPTQTHEHFVRLALKAKKSVLCEKPLTLNQSNVLGLYDLARANRVFLATAFNRHYDVDWQRMHEKAKKGAVGPIQSIRIVSRNGVKPSIAYLMVSGNIFFDTMIHDLDMMLWMMRELPDSIQVVAKTWQQFVDHDPDFLKRFSEKELEMLPQIRDYFMAIVTLQFPTGSIGVIESSRFTNFGNDQRCEIYGSRGMLKCDGLQSSNLYESNDRGINNPGLRFTSESRYSQAYENELEDFATMTELAMSGIYDDKEEVARHLGDYPRGALVAAALKIAEACTKALESKRVHEFVWPEDLKKKFYDEIDL